MSNETRPHLVVVTGASSGIGRAIALAVARHGADVGITYHDNADGAEATATAITKLGRRATIFQLDLADTHAITQTVHEVHATLGHIDAWVNNAGADILTGAGALLSPQEKLDRLLTVDLRGTMLMSWAEADLLAAQPHGGTIINMSWDHVMTGMPGRNPEMFAAAKGGILAFSKSFARSVAPKVRVNIVAPGWIETAFALEAMSHAQRRDAISSTPLERLGKPDDVAQAVLFFLSPAAAFLTGQTIFVNGGVVMP